MTGITSRLESICANVDARLIELLDTMCEPGVLKDAMSYSLLSGGKRLRPALCMITADMFGDSMIALDIACGIEMIHAYSLIHDDLPAMDDDKLRRGKPTNHVVFGEAFAILAGDGLLNCAFEVMVKCAKRYKESGLDFIGAIDIIADAAGARGMIAGQVGDISFEGREANENILNYIHARKTAAMIKAPILASAVLFGASEDEKRALDTYGRCIGLVFQIVDDILDVEGDQDKVGKTLGKDAVTHKQTFIRIFGVDESKKLAKQKTDEAIAAIEIFDERGNDLKQLAAQLLMRDV